MNSKFKMQNSKPAPGSADTLPRKLNREPPKLSRYLGIYAALLKNSVAREMGFKSNFLMWIAVELLWFGLQVSFFVVIYQHTETIADWTKWEVVLLIGASHFI